MSRAELEVGAPESLPISAVARLSGKAASSIRYYEEIGLLEAPERISGRRRYPPAILRTLAVIETAQEAGLSLDEIRLLLQATSHDRAATEQLREVAEQKLPILRAAIERAEIVRGWLEDAARCCCPTLDDCPLFEDPKRLPKRSLVLRSVPPALRTRVHRTVDAAGVSRGTHREPDRRGGKK